MSKITIHYNNKTIDIQNDGRGLIYFLINYGHVETSDVFVLSKEEASFFASAIKASLGEEHSLTPKEKIILSDGSKNENS